MIEVSLTATKLELGAIEYAFLDFGALAITLQDAIDSPVMEPGPGETPLWQEVNITGLFNNDCEIRDIETILGATLGRKVLTTQIPVPQKDWTRAWMDDFHPLQFGERLWICPSWHDIPNHEAITVLLDPGMAFGTGTHPTTALCMKWLDKHPPIDADVVDFGCGSGVLSLAALKLGARHVWAIDNDHQALTATKDNLKQNNIRNDALHASLPEHLSSEISVDLVLANILSKTLIELRQRLTDMVRTGGKIVLSGILEEQAQQVAKAYEYFFELAAPVMENGWILMEGTRKPG